METDADSSAYSGARSVEAEFDVILGSDSLVITVTILILSWLSVTLLASYIRSLSLLNGSSKELLTEANDASSQRLLKLIDEKHQVLLTLNALLIFSRVTVVVFLLRLFAELVKITSFGQPAIILFSIIVLSSLLIILGGRIIPRIVASTFLMPFGKSLSMLFWVIHKLFSPLSKPFTNWFQSALGYGEPNVQYLSGDDLKALADIGEAQGTIEEEERELIHSIMDFGDTTVREIMISRLDMDTIEVTAELQEVLELIHSSGHSRLPVYEEHVDNIIGFVYAKDLLLYMSSPEGFESPNWRKTIRKPYFVQSNKPLDELLKDFRSMKMHIAIVVDKYGGTAGLVTMEDVLEEIVGDIRDEYDEAEAELHHQIDEHTHRFDARINLDDLGELLNIELDFESYDFETLGGLIFHLKGEIPEEGDKIVHESLTMRIESVENHRIGRVLIQTYIHLQPTNQWSHETNKRALRNFWRIQRVERSQAHLPGPPRTSASRPGSLGNCYLDV